MVCSRVKQEENARQWVIDGMQACLPKECSLPFTAVESAQFIKKDVARAQVRMFDGLSGTLLVSREPCGASSFWCIEWLELSGGAINWNGVCWERTATLREMEPEEQQASSWGFSTRPMKSERPLDKRRRRRVSTHVSPA